MTRAGAIVLARPGRSSRRSRISKATGSSTLSGPAGTSSSIPRSAPSTPSSTAPRVQFHSASSLVRDGVEPAEVKDFYPSVSAKGASDAADFAGDVDPCRFDDLGAARRILVDENVPIQTLDLLSRVLGGHEAAHIDRIKAPEAPEGLESSG